jgi:HSP20 family protein
MSKNSSTTSGPKRADDPVQHKHASEISFNLGGFLGKLGGVVEKLVDLADSAETISHHGELGDLDPKGKLRGVYGFSIRSGIGEQGERAVKVEPFGNFRQQPSGETIFEDIREPLVDVHEESDHVLVLAEIPGVSKKDVQLALAGDRLTIQAQRGDKRYQKDVVLPGVFPEETMHWECLNGILKIRFPR